MCITGRFFDLHAARSRAIGFDGGAQLRHVIAQHFAESAGLEEIALHVDDQQRACRRREFERIGFGFDSESLCRFHNHVVIALMNAVESATAPKTPPCIVIIFNAAR